MLLWFVRYEHFTVNARISSNVGFKFYIMTVTGSSNSPLPMLAIQLRKIRSVIGDIMAKSWVEMRLKRRNSSISN